MLEQHVLDRADPVQREGARPGDRPARLDRYPGHLHAQGPALPADDLGQRVGQRRGRQRVVLAGVGDAEAAAEVELGQHHAVLADHLRVQAEQPARGDLEAAGVEDLRADVRVQAAQLKLGPGQRAPHRLGRRARGQRDAELLVLVRGRDVLVGVRLDPDRHPEQHRRPDAQPPGGLGDPVDLGQRVDDDPADPGAAAPGRSRRPTCCCRAGRSARAERRRAARPRARRPSRCPGAGRRPRSSGRPRCTGTPCPRSTRRRRRPGRRTPSRTRRGRRPPGPGSRPRPARTPACRTARPGRARPPRRPRARRPRCAAPCRAHSCGSSSLTSAGGRSHAGTMATPP